MADKASLALRKVYAAGAEVLARSEERLRWTEGIVDVLGDRDRARKVYGGLADQMAGSPVAARVRASREARLGRRYD